MMGRIYFIQIEEINGALHITHRREISMTEYLSLCDNFIDETDVDFSFEKEHFLQVEEVDGLSVSIYRIEMCPEDYNELLFDFVYQGNDDEI